MQRLKHVSKKCYILCAIFVKMFPANTNRLQYVFLTFRDV